LRIVPLIKTGVWLTAAGYVLAWTAATWFLDDGGIVRNSASCARLEEMPLFWSCEGFALSFFANLVTIALAVTYLAPLAIVAALDNPSLWSVALPVAVTNLAGIAALVYAILRLVGWAVRGIYSYARTGEARISD